MIEIGDGGAGLDPGAAVYADVRLDYLDTGRDQSGITAHVSRGTPRATEPGRSAAEDASALTEAFGGAFALLVEHGDGGTTRRRMVMSLAAAERARRRAEDRGQWCRVAVVRLSVVAELDRLPREGGEVHGVAQGV